LNLSPKKQPEPLFELNFRDSFPRLIAEYQAVV
jgi:hypothetical protein